MGSTRLAGKILLPLQGKAMLLRIVDRILQAQKVSDIIVATTTNKRDDILPPLLADYHPRVFIERGSEEDVLDRYYHAAIRHQADIIVRATGDCPFVDPDIIDGLIETLQGDETLDYVSNSIGLRTFPRGLDVECFTFRTLQRCWNEGKEPMDREHVTVYVKRSLGSFTTKAYKNDADFSDYRWTVDEKADYLFAQAVYDRIFKKNPDFRMKDILALLDKEPELIEINRHIEQRNANY